jgi:hypothetical protein
MDIGDTVKQYIDKGVEASKKAFNKAGDAVQDFSDKSVVRIEKRQFEAKRAEQIEALGNRVAKLIITDGSASVSADDAEIAAAVGQIRNFDAEIARRAAVLAEKKS